jgi:hypothetical protein
MSLLIQYYNHVREIGDEAYIIDDGLYVDEGAYFNITMMDSENIFQVQ